MAALSLVACSAPPVDPFCSYAALPPGSKVKAGRGSLQVEGKTTADFYVSDEAGKQIGYQSLGRTLELAPGKYRVKLNNSLHTTVVQKGSLTRCATGTLTVSGTTKQYYYVEDAAGKQLSYHTLGQALSFFPAAFRVKVNNSEAPADLKLNQVAEIRTGTLVVQGSTSEHYYVSDAMGKDLSYNSQGKALALLPGSYLVKINKTEAKADLAAGELKELATGTLAVKGATGEYYYVTDPSGRDLNYQSLNKPLSLFPGNFRIRLNKTEIEAKVIERQASEYQAGSLLVTGKGSGYYYVSDKADNSLNYNALNKALSFFPGEYTVKLGQSSRAATVSAGRRRP